MQHLALSTASALIYYELVGAPLDATAATEMRSVLNDVAHALSKFVPIYMNSDTPTEIDLVDLLSGQFDRGAQVFRKKNGDVCNGLTVVRRDMQSAVVI